MDGQAVFRPSLPLRYRDLETSATAADGTAAAASPAAEDTTLDLSVLSATVQAASETRQAAYDTSRALQASIAAIRANIGTPAAAAALDALLRHPATFALHDDNAPPLSRAPRPANLSHTIEDACRVAAYQHFLETGRLLPPVAWATDEEYLAGAVMGLCCHELPRYGLGRATVRDVASVHAACRLVAAILDYLLQFDFRNGPLRRQYDGCKYALKALETLLYELAVTSPTLPSNADDGPAAHQTTASAEQLLPMALLTALRERVAARDDQREQLIKACRDGQKAAKQCLFALHRGDVSKARALLEQCRTSIARDLWPVVRHEPPLRYGSFAAVVEEYVEARLFFVWLHGRDAVMAPSSPSSSSSGDGDGDNTGAPPPLPRPSGVLLLPVDFVVPGSDGDGGFALEPAEYLGGLSDVTGEIGRYAVACGTRRDVAGVEQCLRTNGDIAAALHELVHTSGGGGGNGGLPPHVAKKLDAVRTSVQKLERMRYELSLSQAAGGAHRPFVSDGNVDAAAAVVAGGTADHGGDDHGDSGGGERRSS